MVRPALIRDCIKTAFLIRKRTLQVAAVLDWECALSGSPLIDVGHFLRYEPEHTPLREPYFSRALVESGGFLPDDWRRISRVVPYFGNLLCVCLRASASRR
jgi:hypothetical protein